MVEKWEAWNMREILPRRLLQNTQVYDKERKYNSTALFWLWNWCQEVDTTMPCLPPRKNQKKYGCCWTKKIILKNGIQVMNPSSIVLVWEIKYPIEKKTLVLYYGPRKKRIHRTKQAKAETNRWIKVQKNTNCISHWGKKKKKKIPVPEHVIDFMKGMNPQQLVDFLCPNDD